MPVIKDESYKPRLLLRNGHLNTLNAYLFRKQKHPAFIRERITTPDDDFLDLDRITQGSRKLAILLHGLEGSTNSQYIIGMTNNLAHAGYDVIALNHRSCSGEMNLKKSFYHSGFVDDFVFLLEKYHQEYESVTAIGYSLGGNVLLRYAGLYASKHPANLERILSVSAPCDLHGSSLRLLETQNKIYAIQFLKTLKHKILLKSTIFPDVDAAQFSKVKTLWDFDEYYTAPLHGFKDAMDYYTSCSSLQVLSQISMPTYLISALDDPFLSKTCFPYQQASENPNFHFIPLKYGGHVGFSYQNSLSYADRLIMGLLTNSTEPTI